MKIDTEMLRKDLLEYTEMAARMGLPLPVRPREEIPDAEEDQLVEMASDLGWDFFKYLTDAGKEYFS
ncbi:MAG: hypothetical protein IJJ52_00745 [Lachnospiraceae bacterium]|nr:hypothetical protein [Lachnospiraceae bacterium]